MKKITMTNTRALASAEANKKHKAEATMSERTREELKRWLITAMSHWKTIFEDDGIPWDEENESCFRAIYALLESQPDEKEIEEFVHEKAEKFLNSIQYIKYPFQLIKTKDFIRTQLSEALMRSIKKDWLPTAENVNALPEPIRRYIHDLATNCDPPSLVQDNIILKENLKALEKMKKPRVSREWVHTLIYICDDVEGGERRIEDIYEWLTEAGMEVEDK